MRSTAVLTTLALLTLCACSSTDGQDEASAANSAPPTLTLPPAEGSPAGEPPAEESTPATTTAPATVNDRGNLEEEPGRQAGIRNADGSQAVVFSIDRIVVNQPCTGTPAPERGHFLGLHVRVTTGDLAAVGGSWSMTPYDFGLLGDDGAVDFDLARPGALDCLGAAERFPVEALEPDSQYSGVIVLDVPVTTGTLLFSTPALQGNGWEWRF
ncbi:hypothetical protein [Geodermatophilus sp. SYSU D00815]